MKERILFVVTVNPFDAKKYYFPPLGPAYLVSSLKKKFKDNFFEFKIINRNFEKEINLFSPSLVGISSMSQNYNIAREYAKIAKRKGCKVIIGGVHISTLPESLSEDMDVGVIGEGEETIKDLLEIYLKNRDFPVNLLKNLKGIIFRENGEIKITEKRLPIFPPENIPHPDRTLVNDRKNCIIFSSRGCFYNCIYCPSQKIWGKVRIFPAEYIVEEIEEIFKRKIKFLNFADYLLTYDKNRLEEIIKLLKVKKILGKCFFYISTISSLIDEEIANLLKEMKVVSVSMNLVSGRDEILRDLKTPNSVKKNIEAIKILKEKDISIYASFSIGLPSETKEEIEGTLKFIKNTKIDNFDIYLPTPYPGTFLWEKAKEKGIVKNEMDWDSLNCDFQRNYKKILIISEKISKKELYKLFRKFQRYKKILKIKNFLTKIYKKIII
jgi:radical SAM superfamily enzyme YgiQ (UPF0313 family)